jgi:hypothetical protein
VGRTTGAEDSPVTLEVKVEFDRVNHITVDNRAGNTIPASVTLIFNAREEANVVPLPNDDESDGRLDTQFDTRIYVNVRSLVSTRDILGKWHTSNKRKFFFENRLELSFGDPI